MSVDFNRKTLNDKYHSYYIHSRDVDRMNTFHLYNKNRIVTSNVSVMVRYETWYIYNYLSIRVHIKKRRESRNETNR